MSYGRLGHNFNLGYADGSLANAGAYTVRPGIATADDEYPFAAGVDELVFRESVSIQNMVLLCQHVEGKVEMPFSSRPGMERSRAVGVPVQMA